MQQVDPSPAAWEAAGQGLGLGYWCKVWEVQERGKAFVSPLSPAFNPPNISICLSLTPSGYKYLCRLGTELDCKCGFYNGSAGATLTQRSANAQLLINSRD